MTGSGFWKAILFLAVSNGIVTTAIINPESSNKQRIILDQRKLLTMITMTTVGWFYMTGSSREAE